MLFRGSPEMIIMYQSIPSLNIPPGDASKFFVKGVKDLSTGVKYMDSKVYFWFYSYRGGGGAKCVEVLCVEGGGAKCVKVLCVEGGGGGGGECVEVLCVEIFTN